MPPWVEYFGLIPMDLDEKLKGLALVGLNEFSGEKNKVIKLHGFIVQKIKSKLIFWYEICK